MASGTPGGNWKNAGASRPAASGSGGGSRRPWQPGGQPKKPASGQRKSRTGRFLLAGFLTATLLALIVIVIWYYQPIRYPELVVVGPNADKSLAVPENSGGVNAAKALAEWARPGDNGPKLAAPAQDTADKDAWQGKLNPNAKSVVLYFTAHGGADAKGPFLWFVPSSAPAPADAHKLYVRDILTRLKSHRSDQPKLLIFDAARLPASWPHGMLFNDFARALRGLEKEIEDVGGLVVICSSDTDERAWGSEDLKSSVFGHFLLEGLKGAAANQPGERITAAGLFKYLSREVPAWVLANRDEKQTPILLPGNGGPERAEAIELATVPVDGYQKPPTPERPGKLPPELEAAWDTATQLSLRVPSPDTLDSGRWRMYLNLLMRWECLVRLGEQPGWVRDHATSLGRQLQESQGAAGDLPCLPVAFPVGRALGAPLIERDVKGFGLLWSPAKGVSRTDEWKKQLNQGGGNETARRVAVAELVVERVLADGPSKTVPTPGEAKPKTTLETADEVLGVVDVGRFGTAEGHFVRILNRRLDPTSRPGDELLVNAIKLRREAEEVAWVGGAGAKEYPYSEQVYRWIQGQVVAGDAARRPGEDLLFHVEPSSWEKAEKLHFSPAWQHYRKAREDAKIVTAALNTRDTVLTRLPYYARWVAGYRGKLPAAEVEQLLKRVEDAAHGAHTLAKLTADVPADPTARLAELKALTDKVNDDFNTVVKAFDTEIEQLTNTVHPSNWHALDNALNVPFIPAKDRVKLVGFVRDVSHQLATKSEQTGRTPASPVAAEENAKRQGRMALAVLGEKSAELRSLVSTPRPGAWQESLRDAGERIGKRYQGLPGESREATKQAAITPTLAAASPHLAEAARLARLVDPAAPLTEEPGAAERRYWQHYFLLWQAKRSIADGWANVNSTATAPSWYCLEAAKPSIDLARTLSGGTEPNLDPAEIDRRLADVRKAEAMRPVVLTLNVPERKTICDETSWGFSFQLARKPEDRVGFPVFWIKPPGEPFTPNDPALSRRQLEPRFEQTASVSQPFNFLTPPAPANPPPPGELVTNVLYRGQLYEKKTDLLLARTPTRDLIYNPPQGEAAYYAIADKLPVAGAVTILIDRSGSMSKVPQGANRSKFQQVYDAIGPVLDQLPPGTVLTIAGFYGDRNRDQVAPAPGAQKIIWRGDNQQKKEVMDAVNTMTPPNEEANTPLARSIQRILSKGEGANYWPPNIAGVRTLIVLTDGADNWDKRDAGQVVLNALLDPATQEDTALHLLFFALNNEEKVEAQKQFEIIEHKPAYQKSGRTPAVVYPDLRTAAGLTDKMRQAVRPRIYYKLEATAANRKDRWILVTLPGEGQYHPSPLLDRGTYDLLNLRNPQKVLLEPGDRVVLQAREKDGKVELFVPPFAYNSAGAANGGWPRGESEAVRMTIPRLKLTDRVGRYHLNMLVTLEAADERPGPYLKRPRPELAWFDIGPINRELNTTVRIENRWQENGVGLVAPAWDVQLTNWDRGGVLDQVRPPVVNAYWMEGRQGEAGTYTVRNLRKPEQALTDNGVVTVDQMPVELISVTVEQPIVKDMPQGEYLTVRLGYRDPTKPLYLRPGKLKGTDQPYELYERHLYYESLGRYTAQFGPLTEKDKAESVVLELYSVTDLKTRASKSGRAVVLNYPADRLPSENGKSVSNKMLLEPRKD